MKQDKACHGKPCLCYLGIQPKKSVDPRRTAQALDSSNYTKKRLITDEGDHDFFRYVIQINISPQAPTFGVLCIRVQLSFLG